MNRPSDPFPRGTGRVVLRRLELADLSSFQAYRRDPDVGEFQGWDSQSDDEAARFIRDMSDVDLFPRGAWVQLGIADRSTDELIGDVGICVSADGEEAEIGFTVAPRAQGSGLGTEAVREVIGLVFDRTDVSRVVAVTDARNVRAHRLVLRAGFQKIKSLNTVFREEPCIEYVWAISRADAASGAKEPTSLDVESKRWSAPAAGVPLQNDQLVAERHVVDVVAGTRQKDSSRARGWRS